MKAYKNLTGISGVSAYETGADFISIEFNHGPIYLYNYQSAGERNIEQMKYLANKGEGLATFINQ
jgi:hypothetical protein